MTVFNVHGAAAPKDTQRVFLISGTANTGYGVCYNADIVDAVAEESSGAATISAPIDKWCDARRMQVERPTFRNAMHFAGVVDDASDGVVGPNWITIHKPGSICEIYAGTVASAGITAGVAEGTKILGFCIPTGSLGAVLTAYVSVGYDQGSFVGPALPGEGAALVLAEGAASAKYMAQLMTGKPCGGVQFQYMRGTADYGQGSSALVPACLIRHGAIMAMNSGAAILSINVPPFPGAELLITGYTGTSDIAVKSGNWVRSEVSLEALAFAVAGDCTITAAEHVHLVAANTVWRILHASVDIT